MNQYTRTEYSTKCDVTNTDHGKTVNADVIDFQPEKRLTVNVGVPADVVLYYQPKHKIYVGSVAGLEFTSSGPAALATYSRGRK